MEDDILLSKMDVEEMWPGGIHYIYIKKNKEEKRDCLFLCMVSPHLSFLFSLSG